MLMLSGMYQHWMMCNEQQLTRPRAWSHATKQQSQKEKEEPMRMRWRKSGKPLLALIGARPSLSLFAYYHHFAMLLLCVLASIMAVLAIISEVLVCIVVLLHPLKVVVPWLQHYGLTFLVIVIFSFAAVAVVLVETRRELKHVKGLITLARSGPEQPPPLNLAEYVEVSMPAWLRSLPQVSLPDDMLETLQQAAPEEPWVQNLAAYVQQHAPEYAPSLSILVSISDRITISVLEQRGRCERYTVTHAQTAAMIGYLALQKKGAWVRRQDIIRPIYGKRDQHLTKHIQRLNDKLNEAAQQVLAGTEGQAGNDVPDKQEEKLKLIEYDERGKEHLWRLLITCDVEILPGVASLYAQITAAEANPDLPPPERDALNRGCHQIMGSYGEGLFASYQKKRLGQYQYWPWATEYYTRYRDQCLAILRYAAKREWAFAMEHKHDPHVLHTSVRQTAQLYAWILQVALGAIPRLPDAEQAVKTCLQLYRRMSDLNTARDIFYSYAVFMKVRDEAWKPPKEMTEVWPEATELEESDTENDGSE